MRRIARTILAAILPAAICAVPVLATPPNIVRISDTLLAIGDTQVFLLRTVDDNLGVHSPAAVDLVLIARSFAPGRPDQVWPISRTIVSADSPDEMVELPTGVDPFEILRSKDAWPGGGENGHVGYEATYEDDAILFRAPASPATFRIDLLTAALQLNASHDAVRAAVPQYPGMNGGEDAVYVVDPATFARECSLMTAQIVPRYTAPDVLLAQFFCALEGDEYINTNRFLVVQPAALP